jgi:hypothetical protein
MDGQDIVQGRMHLVVLVLLKREKEEEEERGSST